jgi:flagellar FliL protein
MPAHAANQETNAEPARASRPWMGKVMVAAFMGGVVAAECLVAYLIFPSPEEVAALAEKNLQKTLPAHLTGEGHGGHEGEGEASVEVDLGEYSVTVSQPNGASSLRVDFHLYGTVAEEEEEHTKHQIERNINRFRDQVLYEIRNSTPSDLADPGLALIKRRILEKSNALFGKPVLKAVVFSQFSYFEQ